MKEAQETAGGGQKAASGRSVRVIVWLLKAFGLWVGFTVFYASMSVCPVCGQQGCVVGIGTSALFGAVFSFFMMRGRTWAGRVWKGLFRRRL